MFRNKIAAEPRFQPGCGQAATAPRYCVVIASEVGKWRNWILCFRFAPCRIAALGPSPPPSRRSLSNYWLCTLCKHNIVEIADRWISSERIVQQ